MSEKDKNILGAFLLARHIEELTNEEIKDVQQAIKRVWNNFDKAIEILEKRIKDNEEIDYVDMSGKSYINYQKEIIDILRGEDNEC